MIVAGLSVAFVLGWLLCYVSERSARTEAHRSVAEQRHTVAVMAKASHDESRLEETLARVGTKFDEFRAAQADAATQIAGFREEQDRLHTALIASSVLNRNVEETRPRGPSLAPPLPGFSKPVRAPSLGTTGSSETPLIT